MMSVLITILTWFIVGIGFFVVLYVRPKWIRRTKEKEAISEVVNWFDKQGYRSLVPDYRIITVEPFGPNLNFNSCLWIVWVTCSGKIYDFTLNSDFIIISLDEYQAVKGITGPRHLKDPRSLENIAADDCTEHDKALIAVRNWFREAKVPDDAISFINVTRPYKIVHENPMWKIWVSYNLHSTFSEVLYKFTLNHDFSIDKVETNVGEEIEFEFPAI